MLQNKVLRSRNRQSYPPAGLDCRDGASKVLRPLAKPGVACSNSAIPCQDGDESLRWDGDLEASTAWCRQVTKLKALNTEASQHSHGIDLGQLRPHHKVSTNERRSSGLSARTGTNAG